jgi:ankyrin repeat protein
LSGTALYYAIRNGHEDIAQLLIDSCAEIDDEGEDDERPLYVAAQYGRLEVVKLLLARGANVKAPTGGGRFCRQTPLGIAIEQGHVDVVETLIAAGVDVNARDKSGCTPLRMAVTSDCRQAVDEAIHQKYADSAPVGNAEFDAFVKEVRDRLATRMGALLVDRGANVNETDEAGVTPLHYATATGLKGVVELLLAEGVDANARTLKEWWFRGIVSDMRVGVTALHAGAARGDANTVKVLLAHGAQLDAKDESGCTLLHYAATLANPSVVEFLIAKGANVNAEDRQGATPLVGALLRGRVRTAEALIAAGAKKVDIEEHFAKMPRYGSEVRVPLLHEALKGIPRMWGDVEAADSDEGGLRREWIKLLLANGADPDERDEKGNTPLHAAILLGNEEAAGLFIAHGADVNARNESRIAALHYAANGGQMGIVTELLAKGADVNARDNHGDTPLHNAALRGYREVVEVLVAHGADANARNSRGRTPLDEATRRRHNDIVQLLTAKTAVVGQQ